jgi:hypothetical protein
MQAVFHWVFHSAAKPPHLFLKYFCYMFVYWYLKTTDFFSHLRCWVYGSASENNLFCHPWF